jgi:hypothetical protein
MTADFMQYGLAVSLLFAVATLGAEQVCALYRWPRRFLWGLALAASLAFPLSMSLTTRPSTFTANEQWIEPAWLPDHLPSTPSPTRYVRSARLTRVSAASGSILRSAGKPSAREQLSLDGALNIGWFMLSIALLAYYGLAWLRLRRTIALAPRRDIDGMGVRVTHDMGPAVFGLVHPEILIPQWILEAPAPTRSLALEHEREHISAGDPVLLFVGLVAVVLVPWNPALWWMLRRLRFSIEADCDARVLRCTADARAYAEALLTVSEHRALLPTGSVALTSPRSWLERRVRIMLAETSRLSRVLAVSGSVWAVAVLGLAVLLHAPSLAAQGELRKFPPQDMKPATRWVQSLARARYPQLFDPSFDGMAEVTMLLNQDGSLVRSQERMYRPEELPRADSSTLMAELALDPGDVLYSDVVDFRPLDGAGRERAIGYINYAVLKWPHDPLRAQSRVEAAVKAYYPELTAPGRRDQRICTYEIAVLMNDDGTVRDAHNADEPCDASWSADELSELNDFGIPQEELGRGGELYFTSATQQGVFVRYTWPRHADDPPNVQDLSSGRVNAAVWTRHPPRPDTHDDAAIIDRYFADIEAQGGTNLFTMIDGRRYVFVPWILFGRDGKIWGAGRSSVPVVGSSENKNGYLIGPALGQEIEARYPGIRTWGGLEGCLPRVHGVPIQCFWISPDSPVQRLSDMDFSRRKHLLVLTDFREEVRPANPNTAQPFIMSFAHAMNFGTPAGTGMAQWFDRHGSSLVPVTTRLIATEAGPRDVDLELQIRRNLTTTLSQPPSDQWVQAATMRIPYESSGTVDLYATDANPRRKVQIILRPELLHDPSDPR